MFERFTAKARNVVVAAREAATARGDSYIGTEHLLLALSESGSGKASEVLNAVGITNDRVRQHLVQHADRPALVTDEDLEVLEDLGIDAVAILEDARRAARGETGQPSSGEVADLVAGALKNEENSDTRSALARARARLRRGGGAARSGHVPFTPKAKKVLEYSLREALTLHDNYIGTEHLLLGLVRQGGLAADVLVELGVDLADVRRRAVEARPGAA